MSRTALMVDALIMGIAAGFVVWHLLEAYGTVPQWVGAYVIGRMVSIILARWTD